MKYVLMAGLFLLMGYSIIYSLGFDVIEYSVSSYKEYNELREKAKEFGREDFNKREFDFPFVEEYQAGRSLEFYVNNAYEPERDFRIGLFYFDHSHFNKTMSKLDVSIDEISIYRPIESLDTDEFINQLIEFNKQGYKIRVNILFSNVENSDTLLSDIALGLYDNKILNFITKINNSGINDLIITTLHEFNSNYYPWGIYYGNNTIELYHSAFKHVVSLFRQNSNNFKFMINYNRKSTVFVDKEKNEYFKHTFAELYPGDEWVDYVGITSFNRAFTSPYHQTWDTFSNEFKDAYNQVIGFTNKPIIITEISSTSYVDSDLSYDSIKKADWIRQAIIDIDRIFTNVVSVTWFFKNKGIDSTGHSPLNWDLNTIDELQAFRHSVGKIK